MVQRSWNQDKTKNFATAQEFYSLLNLLLETFLDHADWGLTRRGYSALLSERGRGEEDNLEQILQHKQTSPASS